MEIFQVICLLKQLSQNDNMSIIVTIHQPSYRLFELFDKVYALTNSGNCIYYGRPNELRVWLNHFNEPIETLHNPAHILIEVASRDIPTHHNTYQQNSEWHLNDLFYCFSSYERIPEEPRVARNEEPQKIKQMKAQTLEKIQIEKLTFDNKFLNLNYNINGLCDYKMGFKFRSLSIMLSRTLKNSVWRERKLLFSRFILHAIIAFILLMLYKQNMGDEDGCLPISIVEDTINCTRINNEPVQKEEDLVTQNTKFQFFSLLFLMFAALMPTILTFPREVKVFMNEHRNGWYSTGTYYLSKTIAEIPIQLLFPYLYTWLLYAMTNQIGMNKWYYGIPGFWNHRFGYFVVFTELTAFISQGIAFCIGIIFIDHLTVSIFVSSSLLLLHFLFSGFFIKISQMSYIAQTLTDLSFVRFSFEGLMIILYGLERCNKTIIFNGTVTIGNQTKSVVMEEFDLQDDDLWAKDLTLLVFNLFFWRILAYFALKLRVDNNFLRFR